MIYWAICTCEHSWLEAHAGDFLSAQEQTRLEGMRFAKRRREWLLGRWTAKHLLVTIQPEQMLEPDAFSVMNREEGAPYYCAINGEPLPFVLSISHREDLAFCAVSTNERRLLGVDIEWIERREPAFLNDYFTAGERAYALDLNEEQRVVWVTAAWSLKESVLKALGKGLRVDTRRVNLGFETVFEANTLYWSEVKVETQGLDEAIFSAFWRKRDGYVLTIASSVIPEDGGEVSCEGIKEVNLDQLIG